MIRPKKRGNLMIHTRIDKSPLDFYRDWVNNIQPIHTRPTPRNVNQNHAGSEIMIIATPMTARITPAAGETELRRQRNKVTQPPCLRAASYANGQAAGTKFTSGLVEAGGMGGLPQVLDGLGRIRCRKHRRASHQHLRPGPDGGAGCLGIDAPVHLQQGA